jgi:hypothetical protein
VDALLIVANKRDVEDGSSEGPGGRGEGAGSGR